ncbi:MAG: CSLREA domain-containing protein, partial [Pyrinomonadaceae bacterium]|nr:CSLREA domain-containing protein [Pyrinomonadaceae bacterium]
MKIAIKSTRSLGGAVLLTFVGLAGWSALPDRFRTWLEPTAHAGAMIFVVNSAADPGDGTCNASNCTLREAINAANSNLGLDTINFNIAGAGVKTINLTSALPTITAPVQIFGVTQPGYASAPLIELNGAGAGTGAHGIQITGGGSFVVALTINRFGGDGVRISGAGGNFVLDNYIGTNNAGSASQGNAGAGVRVTGSPNNTVGGGFCASFLGCSESQLKYGVISGNGGNGVVIEGVGATGNVVQRSYIGTNADGTADLGNRFSGVILLNEASNNIIGGTTTTARNVISGNDLRGVSIGGSGNQVLGNFIGTSAAGNAALGNNLGGVSVGGVNNTLGGTASGARNIISGNGS